MNVDSLATAERTDAVDLLMRARSVAVIGASDDRTRISGRPLHFLLTSGFDGEVYAVNPARTQVQGVRCHATVAELPTTPDVAVIAVPAAATMDVVRECAAAGVRVAVVTGSGFGETGDAGRALQEQMVDAAKASGMRILGPNCLGAFNAHTGMYATFSQTLVDRFPEPGPVAIVSQSGAYGSHLGFLAQQRRLGVGYWVTTGNEADIDVAEALSWLVEQDEVKVVMVYVEGVQDGTTFRAALNRARAQNKPVIVLKTGRSAVGAQMAGSHTGALAGADDVFDAVLKESGAYRADTIEEQLDIAYACAHSRPTEVRRLGVVTVSGGIGAHICDVADRFGLEMPVLSESAQARLLELVPYAAVSNPIDCTGQVLQDSRITAAAFESLIEDAECDAVLGFYSTVPSTEIFAERLYQAMEQGTGGDRSVPLVICMVAEQATIRRYEDSGVLVFDDPDRAVRAIAGLAYFAEAFATAPGAGTVSEPTTTRLEHRIYTEIDAKHVLAGAGVPVLEEALVVDADAAVAAAERIGWPTVLKVVSPDITHKSDIGGVALGLADPAAVREAFAAVTGNARAAMPDAAIDGVLVTRMAEPGTELIIGGKVDPVFGPVIMVGWGGVYVEILSEVALRLAPIDVDGAHAMLQELKGAGLLTGARGREPLDVDAVARCLVAVSGFLAEQRDVVEELDINPLLVYPEGRGALAVDAVLVTRATKTSNE